MCTRSKREFLCRSPLNTSQSTSIECVPPSPQLHYFDCFDDPDDILFFDILQVLPDTFSNCYDYHDPITNDYYNSYFDSSLFDIFHYISASSLQQGSTIKVPDTVTPPTSLPVDNYLSSFDILKHYYWMIQNIPSYSNICRLLPGDPIYNQILLNDRGLQAKLRTYGEVIPLQEPIIYHSSTDNELPIVIDTGASCSITPSALDFDAGPVFPDFHHLTGISSKTSVNSQGTVTWLIEDVKGVQRPITTKAYLVNNAGIRLFSLQTYLQENKHLRNNPNLLLDRDGVKLTLECGACLSFPLQSSSNLPFMLTEGMLNSSKPTNFTSFIAGSSTFQPTRNSSSIPSYSRIAPGVIPFLINTLSLDTERIRALPKFVDQNILSQRNRNLSPPQKELLLWHQRLGHADLSRIQSLLCKPRTLSRDKRQRRLVNP